MADFDFNRVPAVWASRCIPPPEVLTRSDRHYLGVPWEPSPTLCQRRHLTFDLASQGPALWV